MNTRFFQFFSLFLVITLFFACATDQVSDATDQNSTDMTAQMVASAKVAPSLPFPVYENFSELEHIFQYENDTTYVINFWATWCKPCIAELPYFEQLDTDRGAEKLKVILVSLDFAKDVETKLFNFVKQRQLKPQVIALTDGKYNNWIDKVHPDWGGAIPVTYIYKGEQVYFHDQQYEDYEELIASVKKISE